MYLLSYNTSLAYVDHKGNHPTQQPIRNMKDLDNMVRGGKIYTVEFDLRGRSWGHIVTAERGDDGKVRLYDPQSNKMIKNQEISKYLSKTRNIKIMDLTGYSMDEKFCDKIMKKVKR